MHGLIHLGAVAVLLLATPELSPDEYPSSWKDGGKGKTYVLYRKHNVTAMSQGQVGSCVGTAVAKALEMQTGRKYSAEWCYAISRDYFDASGDSPGSYGVWGAQAMRDVGPVLARNYAILGYNLEKYKPSVAKSWQARGPPESMRAFADGKIVTGFVQITTWEELRDSIAQGNPVIVGSSVGFGRRRGQVRSRTGTLRARWWSRWHHAMVFCGVSDGKSKRALLLNSWGRTWVKGPKWLGDEPDGSFWISKRDARKMIRQGDAWSLIIR